MTNAPAPLEELYDTLRQELLTRRLLIDTGVPGVYGRSQIFEQVITGIDHAFDTASAGDGAEVLRFPPIINRKNFEKVEYIKAFPQLMGIIHTFTGNDKQHRELLPGPQKLLIAQAQHRALEQRTEGGGGQAYRLPQADGSGSVPPVRAGERGPRGQGQLPLADLRRGSPAYSRG